MLHQLLVTVQYGEIMASNDNIKDEDIQALVDNELPPRHAAEVMTAIEEDSWLKERYDELCRQKMLLLQWWDSERNRLH